MRARASRGKKVIGPNRAARVNHSRTKELLTLPYKGASLLGRGHFTFHTTYFNRRTAVPCRLQIWIKCVREDETFSPFQATLLLIWLIDTRTHLRFEGLFVFLHKCGAESFSLLLRAPRKLQIVPRVLICMVIERWRSLGCLRGEYSANSFLTTVWLLIVPWWRWSC